MEIFVGWDSREPRTYAACVNSIESVSPDAVIRPIKLNDMKEKGIFWRPKDELASTEFSVSRFLVPWLAQSDVALFCDADFIFTEPLEHLFQEFDRSKAVQVVKHDFKVNESVKMDGKPQTMYPRKWWSALVLWNMGHPANGDLMLKDVNSRPGAWLHRFSWLPDDLIGDLSPDWHWLDGYSTLSGRLPRGIHYTLGTPELGREHISHRYVWDRHAPSAVVK